RAPRGDVPRRPGAGHAQRAHGARPPGAPCGARLRARAAHGAPPRHVPLRLAADRGHARAHLRRKLDDARGLAVAARAGDEDLAGTPGTDVEIATVYGVGYKLVERAGRAPAGPPACPSTGAS